MKPADWHRPLYVIDVEGNGANPPDLVEVAAIPLDEGRARPERARTWLIQPPTPIPACITRIHGITNTMLEDAPSWEQSSGEVRELLDGAWIAAHHASVEYNALTRHLPDWQPEGVLDTLRLAKDADPGQRGYGLDALLERTGIDLSGVTGQRHRAAFDAHATALLLLHLAERYPAWDALVAAAVPPRMPGAPAPAPPPTIEETLW
ncbi:exonuclease domain-containing protein [Streptomyces sp. NPDC048172]|uniref:3'-5' exonuclease n=1 Tax=Streptomyces sp. NPDC048172 TaxID=3365505 RepID=UPI003723E8DE